MYILSFFQNLQFAEALESRVTNIYNDSWIYKYYDYNVKSEDGIVLFWDSTNKRPTNSERFRVFLYIPEKTRPYFFSKSEWLNFQTPSNYVILDIISHIPHGFKTKCFPATKSLFYTSPFFFKLKTPLITASNYLLYKDTYKPNFKDCILAMVTYSVENDNLIAEFSPQLTFHYKKNWPLSPMLEFILVDANNQQLKIEDNSYLFFSLTVHSN